MSKLLAIILATLAAGCGPVEEAVLSRDYMQVEVVGVNPPKHFYVDLREPGGLEHKRVYVSKHCNSWRTTAKIGKKIKVTKTVSRMNDGTTRTRFTGMKRELCTST